MKRRRARADQPSRQQLLSLWQGEEAFGRPIGCVATTYTFDAAFFEEQCLARFVGMENDADEDKRSYALEREERLSQVGAWVLVDQAHVAAARSLRWHLLPVRVPGGGIMHAKITLLAWERRVRVLIGSANLTLPGYRSNFENVAALDFGDEGGPPRELLTETIAFLDAIRARSPGHGTTGAQRTLDGFLRAVERRVSVWPQTSWQRGQPRCWFVPVAPNRKPLFEQLEILSPFSDADQAWVLSPFFDDGPAARETVDSLQPLMLERGERTVHFLSPGRRRSDDSVELDLPECLRQSGKASLDFGFGFVPERDPTYADANLRNLHAKSIWLERGDRALFVMGSSNFTRAGTGIGPRVNVEANLAYALPDVSDAFARACEAAYPPYEVVDPQTEILHFVGKGIENSDEAEGHVPLPEAFGAATFVPGHPGTGNLRLELGTDPPPGFVVQGSCAEILLDHETWVSSGHPALISRSWPHERPPSFLGVAWVGADGTPRRALWVVNVDDTASLPPPEELRNLDLATLMEILTSARPIHEVAPRLLDQRATTAASALEVDPHKKVDTRNYLLNRMKRLSTALESLRERLEQPVFSLEALRWRLHGPLGVMALARRLAAEEGEAASFMIAEVALTVRDATPVFPEGVDQFPLQQELQATIRALQEMALAQPGPANLNEYVRQSFAELAS